MRKIIGIICLLHLFSTATFATDNILIRPGLKLESMKAAVHSASRPLSLDNSTSPYFPPVITQYGGSCAQASAIHYLFTYEMNRFMERPVQEDNTRIFSYRWSWNYLNGGKDEGSFVSDGLEITRDFGCMTVADFGGSENEYIFRWTTGYQQYYNAMHYRTKEIKEIDLHSKEGIENLLDYMYYKADGHPGGGIASFSISINDWSSYDYNGPSETGIEEVILLKGSSGPHAMTLVGYDLTFEYDFNHDGIISDNEKGAFILMNSWGTWWGTDGKAYMPFYHFLTDYKDGGLYDSNKNALCIDVRNSEPQITIKVRLSYSSRNDLMFSMGVSEGAQAKESNPRTNATCGIMKNQGGDLYMQGGSSKSYLDIELGLDYTDKASAVDTMVAPCYFLNVYKTAVDKLGSGYVSQVTVHDYRPGHEGTFTQTFNSETGKITVGINKFKVPTKNWVKRNGKWLRQSTTSGSPVQFSYTVGKDAPTYSIRTASQDYASMKITKYDESKKQIKVKFMYYDE